MGAVTSAARKTIVGAHKRSTGRALRLWMACRTDWLVFMSIIPTARASLAIRTSAVLARVLPKGLIWLARQDGIWER
jgi:hypothetical protein